MKRLLPKLVLACLGSLLGLAIAEGISRFVYTKPWYERLAEEQIRDVTASVKRNSLGLRDREYDTPKPPRCKRVLILGDSFTFGWGVLDGSAIFPEVLEKRLNDEFAGQGTSIEVLNGGIPGSLTSAWVDLVEKVKSSFQPDAILIVFFLRDGTVTTAMEVFFGPIREGIVTENERSFLYKQFYLFRLYKDYRDRRSISEKYARALNQSYLGNEEQTQEWRAAQENLRRIKALGEAANAKVGLVVFPVLVELNDHYPFKAICEVLTKFGRENGIPTHDLLPAFLGEDAPSLWASDANQHPNPRGHEIAADSILPFLRELLKD